MWPKWKPVQQFVVLGNAIRIPHRWHDLLLQVDALQIETKEHDKPDYRNSLIPKKTLLLITIKRFTCNIKRGKDTNATEI